MDVAANDPFRQLQVLTLVTLALFLAPGTVPGLRRHARTLRIATALLYFGGGGLILLNWYLRG